MAWHNDLGKKGEDLAFQYLKHLGYEILARNWRMGHLELDIVCRYGNFLIVVEVKTRMSRDENPAELLNWKKRKNLIQAADAFVKKNKLSLEVRIDLLIVYGDTFEIEYIPEAVTVLD